MQYFTFVFFFLPLCRLNSSLISLVAIAANPTESTSNLTQRTTNGPTIVKNVHLNNGNSSDLVNMTNAESLSKLFVSKIENKNKS